MGDPERDRLRVERDALLAERQSLLAERAALQARVDALTDERDRLLERSEAAPIHRRRAPIMPGAPGRWASGTSAIQAAAERMVRATEPPDDARPAGSGDIIAAL